MFLLHREITALSDIILLSIQKKQFFVTTYVLTLLKMNVVVFSGILDGKVRDLELYWLLQVKISKYQHTEVNCTP